MGAFETMLKGMREAKEQEDKGDFDWKGGSELLATLRADQKTPVFFNFAEFKVHLTSAH